MTGMPRESPLRGPPRITVDDRGDLYVGKVAMTHAKLNRGARTLQKFARQR